MKIQHLMAPQSLLPEVLKGAIMQNLTTEPLQLAKERMKQIFKIRKMAQELDPEEAKLKAQLEPEVARVLAPKRILLWEKLLQASQYQDMGIVDMVKRGIPLHGEHDNPQIFPADWKPATATAKELLDGAVWRRCALQSSRDDCRRSGLNSAYTVNFKLELLDLDVLAATASAIAMSLKSGGSWREPCEAAFTCSCRQGLAW